MKMKCLLFALTLAFVLSGCAGDQSEPAVPTTIPATEPVTLPVTEPAETATPTEPQTLAPDITVYDLEGKEVRLSDFRGKPVVLNFWASWCGPCKSEMPDFQEKYEALGEEVQFMMVNLTDGQSETVETASAFIAEQGYTFPVFYDTAMDGAYSYSISSIPATYFIDEAGNAVAWANGAIDGELLQQGIDMILP